MPTQRMGNDITCTYPMYKACGSYPQTGILRLEFTDYGILTTIGAIIADTSRILTYIPSDPDNGVRGFRKCAENLGEGYSDRGVLAYTTRTTMANYGNMPKDRATIDLCQSAFPSEDLAQTVDDMDLYDC